jgi:hypothetical protein
VLTAREGRALVAAAEATFYQDRTWPALLAGLPPRAQARWRAFAAAGLPDPKADDARACLAAAASFARARGEPPPPPWPPRPRPSHVRRRRLAQSGVLERLAAARDAAARADDGLRRLVVAAAGRALGIEVSRAEAVAAGAAWLDDLGVPRRARAAFLAESGLDAAEAERLFEALALEARVLDRAARLFPDGPSREEGLALAARLDGTWARRSRRRSGEEG